MDQEMPEAVAAELRAMQAGTGYAMAVHRFENERTTGLDWRSEILPVAEARSQAEKYVAQRVSAQTGDRLKWVTEHPGLPCQYLHFNGQPTGVVLTFYGDEPPWQD